MARRMLATTVLFCCQLFVSVVSTEIVAPTPKATPILPSKYELLTLGKTSKHRHCATNTVVNRSANLIEEPTQLIQILCIGQLFCK